MLIREIRLQYGGRVSDGGAPVSIRNAREAIAVMRPLLEGEVCEVGYVLCLTTKMNLIGYHEISRGSLDATSMHPREVFKAAVIANAASIILVHNHPSGDPLPSRDDVDLTTRLKQAGELMGIDLLDHVIIGEGDRYASFRELGRL